MNVRIKKYLDRITASILNPEDAEMVRLELEDHIMTKVELLLLSGTDEDSAIEQTLSEMGDEEELEEDLGMVHSTNRMSAKIVYESEKGQCGYLARRLGTELGIPYGNVKDNPRTDNCELLVIIRKGACFGKARPELSRYIQGLKKNRIKIVVVIYVGFVHTSSRSYPPHAVRSGYGGSDGKLIKKMLEDKGIEAIEEKYCYRSNLRLGILPEAEIELSSKYLAKMLGTYV